MFVRMMGYVKDTGFLGDVVGVDFVNEMVMLKDDDLSVTEKIKNVEILKEAFEMHDIIIYDKDVLGDVGGDRYLVERHDNGDVTLHKLNDKLELVHSGTRFRMTDSIIDDFEMAFDLAGNFYELQASLPKAPTFNIKIVKDFNGKHYTYFYACNNKEEEEIDLIKVIYMGSTLIEEEDYQRITLSHEEYMEAVESGIYKEVTPQELSNYVIGMRYGKKGKSLNEMKADSDEIAKVCGVNCGCTDFCKREGNGADTDKPVEDTDTPVDTDGVPCDKCGYSEPFCDCKEWD